VPTELGRSQVEVQRCTLSSDVGKELGEVGKATVDVEVEAEVVEEMLAEEEQEDS